MVLFFLRTVFETFISSGPLAAAAMATPSHTRLRHTIFLVVCIKQRHRHLLSYFVVLGGFFTGDFLKSLIPVTGGADALVEAVRAAGVRLLGSATGISPALSSSSSVSGLLSSASCLERKSHPSLASDAPSTLQPLLPPLRCACIDQHG